MAVRGAVGDGAGPTGFAHTPCWSTCANGFAGRTGPGRRAAGGAVQRDRYVTAGKRVIDWDDEAVRTGLVDGRARDGYALLEVLEGREDLAEAVDQAARLLATVLGQDLEPDPDNPAGWRIARRVAKDRVISTVDPQARHGHNTNYRGFDGSKVMLRSIRTVRSLPRSRSSQATLAMSSRSLTLIADLTHPDPAQPPATSEEPPAVYGDSAYGAGDVLEQLEDAGSRR